MIRDEISAFFKEEKIEYYTVLSYSDCIESAPRIMERECFKPRSVILFLMPYYTGEVENLSRYAASLDYHIALRGVAERLSELLSSRFPGMNAKGYGDHSPINERHAALIGGLGIAGKNGLLINEKYGTYTFIGDLVTDIAPEALGATAPLPISSCEDCGACRRACPTGILAGTGDSCLSEITQRKGVLAPEEIELMTKYNTVWGCDLCQSSCPYNKNPIKTPIDFFYRDRIDCLTPELLDKMTKEELKERAFGWRGRATVRRNLELLFK